MDRNPYQVLGVGIPPMLGRERLFDRLCRHLTKADPDHVCVVGPTLFGKSVLLNHLASHVPDGHYVASLYWDLRHGTPKTDDGFRRRFAERVRDALEPDMPELAEWLNDCEESPFDLLEAVFDELSREGRRLLAILDGFDHLLKDCGITRSLWDQLRNLGHKPSLRLVTGSRARLRELCKDEDSRTSDFWEIFYDTPLLVGCLEDDDWSGFLAPFPAVGIELDGSAHKEIRNWTGGVPVLAAALADRLMADSKAGDVLSKTDIDAVAGEMADEMPDTIRELWDDCSIEVQSLLTAFSGHAVPLPEVPDHQTRDLERRGFARKSREGLRSSCRLMDRYSQQRRDEVAYLQRLFGTSDRFDSSIRGLLELHLKRIADQADPKLAGYIRNAVRDLRPDPDASVVWMRSIADTTLNLIWEAELGKDTCLPEDWKALYSEGKAPDRLPPWRGAQCYLLRLITGTDKNPRRVAKFVTKPTFLLVDHLQSVGNFGQHREGQEVTVPLAAAFCLSAIELCDRLSRELPVPRLSTAHS